MVSRKQLKRARSKPPSRAKAEEDRKDQLVCDLELQQTIQAARIHELERTRTSLAAFYEQSPIGYLTLDPYGRIHDVNGTILQLLGIQRERLLAVPLTSLAHPRDGQKLLNHLTQCQGSREGRVVTELRLRALDRRDVPVQLITLVVHPAQTSFLTAVIDLTERVRHEKALSESKEFAEAIINTVRHPLAVLDSDLRIVSINPAFADFFKRSKKQIQGRVLELLLNLWWSGNQLRAELEKVLIKNQPLEDYRIEAEPAGLGPRILMLNARPMFQKENTPQRLLVVLEDVTERERAREDLRRLNDELEKRVAMRTEALQKSNEQMESFCYSIAHDLRAPLRSMSGFSHLLVDRLGKNGESDIKNFAERIRLSAERMDRLIVDLLQYGRLNTVDLPMQVVNLEQVFQEVMMQLTGEIEERRARISKPAALPTVCGNPTVLHVVLANLISNAMKFVPRNAVPEITVSSEQREPFTRLWIADNGIGIAPENQQKIFGVFHRLHHPDRYPGTGIGLALVSRGIERIGGRVGVESELGKGSRFWFEVRQPPNPDGNSENAHRAATPNG